jgi:hypothetical protein
VNVALESGDCNRALADPGSQRDVDVDGLARREQLRGSPVREITLGIQGTGSKSCTLTGKDHTALGSTISGASVSVGTRRASAAFSPDGRRILTQWQGVTWDSFKASLWDAETGNLLRDLCEIRVARGRRDLNPITISPDGRWGISAGGYLREPYRELAGRSG